ncbi:hypothetical protein ARALYDRAFT_902576 [Arabidopsis lyrata subsp. lyrata]|uniref:Uncharacterized protein n=1 Tax=Arabidopsis lyrata subsp. lyrata TaxID=81972 RepID=D7LHP4_ARALL|nr:hypothetical protein ARALYDRAFT_902576 [Arabidopsis lyrata subsp. lyrata]
MVYLPQGILIDIVRRVGNHGFRELAPFIASGPDGKNAGNITARYVEGLRRAVKLGPSNENLQLMRAGEEYIPYAGFAFGVFAICGGHYEEGMEALTLLAERAGWLEEMVDIGERVMAQIADIEPPMSGNYDATFTFPHGDVPNCVHFACTMDDVCFDCIAYWYSRRVRQLC